MNNLQRRSELSWGTTLLSALSGVTAAVSTLTVTALTAAASTTSTEWLALLAVTLTTHHSAGRCVRALLLDVGSRNDLSGEMEPLAEVVETLWGEGVVVVLPRELGLDISARGERLASLDNVQVLCVDVVVLWQVVVLLGDKDTLTEEVLVDLLAVGLGDEPARKLVLVFPLHTIPSNTSQYSRINIHFGGFESLTKEAGG